MSGRTVYLIFCILGPALIAGDVITTRLLLNRGYKEMSPVHKLDSKKKNMIKRVSAGVACLIAGIVTWNFGGAYDYMAWFPMAVAAMSGAFGTFWNLPLVLRGTSKK